MTKRMQGPLDPPRKTNLAELLESHRVTKLETIKEFALLSVSLQEYGNVSKRNERSRNRRRTSPLSVSAKIWFAERRQHSVINDVMSYGY